MPKKKYSRELKEKVLAEYAESGDAKLVAARHGISHKQVWQWKAVQKMKPEKDQERLVHKLKKELAIKEEENALLREIVKKTAMVMPIN